MNIIFEVFSWLALISLTSASIPQIILIFKKKSTEGVSWPTYGLLLFGVGFFFVRSLITTNDIVIQSNFGISTLVVSIANFQFFYYRVIIRTSRFTRKP
jgi:uncharacterized protein with PQ loop repeat